MPAIGGNGMVLPFSTIKTPAFATAPHKNYSTNTEYEIIIII